MPRKRRQLLLAVLFACAVIAGPTPLAGAAQQAYTLRVFVTGNGTVEGSGITCGAAGTVCGASYALGTTISIQATPAQFSVFAGWTGACTGVGNTCTLTAGEPTTVTATFGYIEVVDVNKTGEGSGTVVSSPAGINCPGTCAMPYTGNTKITLSARPAAGSIFVGWNGYCKGKAACVLQQTYGTMPVVAQFEKKGWKPGQTTAQNTTGGSSSTGPFTATNRGASVRTSATGRVITVNLSVSRPAAIRLQIWKGNKLISQARLAVKAGPVTIRYPFSAGYAAGEYHAWAYVMGQGENPKKPKLLHWKLQVP